MFLNQWRGSKMFFFPGPKRANWKQTHRCSMVFYLKDPEGSIRINQSKLCEPCPVLLAHCRRGVDDQIELSLGGPKSLGGTLKNLSPIHQSSSSQVEGTCFLFDILREPSELVKGLDFQKVSLFRNMICISGLWCSLTESKCMSIWIYLAAPNWRTGFMDVSWVFPDSRLPNGPHLKKSPGD
jgi:hypothetical protein